MPWWASVLQAVASIFLGYYLRRLLDGPERAHQKELVQMQNKQLETQNKQLADESEQIRALTESVKVLAAKLDQALLLEKSHAEPEVKKIREETAERIAPLLFSVRPNTSHALLSIFPQQEIYRPFASYGPSGAAESSAAANGAPPSEKKTRSIELTSKAVIVRKRISDVTNGLYVFVDWNGQVDIEKEFQQAKKHCQAFEVMFDHQFGQDYAILSAVGAHDDENLKELNCLRLYMIEQLGWIPTDTGWEFLSERE